MCAVEAGQSPSVDVTDLIDGVLAGNRRILARAISRVEAGGAEARAIVAGLHPYTSRAHIVGVTGSPGIGKSTLVAELARAYRQRSATVGIVAVDPTSPFSGGAILGDRIRMRDLAGDAGVFVRSMATRGHLGGLAAATSDVIRVLDAAGYHVILVETVGVGQAEVDVARMAHTTLVVEAPGLGDDVQTLKAGIMEIADVFVVNKSDLPGADAVVTALRAALSLSGAQPAYVGHHFLQTLAGAASPAVEGAGASWQIPIVEVSAVKRQGLPEVLDAVGQHLEYLHRSGLWTWRERQRVQMDLEAQLQQLVMERVMKCVDRTELDRWIEDIVQRRAASQDVAGRLLDRCLSAG